MMWNGRVLTLKRADLGTVIPFDLAPTSLYMKLLDQFDYQNCHTMHFKLESIEFESKEPQ